MSQKRWLKRIVLLVCFALLWAGFALPAGWAENSAPSHNYILIIDNSRSTTGRHSLGGATDPRGLRFDAARLVYQNVISSAVTHSPTLDSSKV